MNFSSIQLKFFSVVSQISVLAMIGEALRLDDSPFLGTLYFQVSLLIYLLLGLGTFLLGYFKLSRKEQDVTQLYRGWSLAWLAFRCTALPTGLVLYALEAIHRREIVEASWALLVSTVILGSELAEGLRIRQNSRAAGAAAAATKGPA